MKGIKLWEWQDSALQKAYTRFAVGDKFVLTHATPGGGKTVYALSAFKTMVRDGFVTHCIIVVPSSNLERQWTAEGSAVIGAEFKNSMLYNGMSDFDDYNGMCITYQAAHQNSEELQGFCSRNKTLVIADEMHHVADGQSWGESFRTAFDDAQHILGLTGTPWASNGRFIPYVKYDDQGYAAPLSSYHKQQAIDDKVCRAVEFYGHKPKNLSFSNRETGEFLGEYETLDDAIDAKIKGAYLKTLQSVKHMTSLFTPANEQVNSLRRGGRPYAAGLIVAPDIKTAKAFQDEVFRLTGHEYPLVHSKMEKPHKVIRDFKKSSTKWLISVDMITEGIDIKRLQVLVFLSSKNTELFVRQVTGRIERVIDKNSTLDKTAYFYYTDVPDLRRIVSQMEEENEIGLAADEGEPEGPEINLPTGGGGDGPRPYDGVSLEEVETELNGLVFRGLDYDGELVAEAIIRRRESARLEHIELSIVCEFILADREKDNHRTGRQENGFSYDDDLPLAEKKTNMRRGITERINSKLGQYIRRKPSGDDIRKAHTHINKAIGIKGTNENISYEDLLKKFDYVCQTDAATWLS